MKKREGKGIALLVSAIIVIAVTSSVAVATDWPQFQKDEIATGWTTDCAPVNDPTLAWSYEVASTGWAGVEGTPIVGDGKVFVLNYAGELFIFDALTGQCINSTMCNDAAGGFELSTPAYHNGIVYVATSKGNWGEGHGRVTAIYAEDGAGHNAGEIREQVDLGEGLPYFQLNTPVRYADGKIYLGNWKGGPDHTEDNGTYYCLDAADVTNEIWSRTAPYVTGYYWAGVAIVGNYVIYGDDRANVTCLNKVTGAFVDYVNVSEPPFNINDPVEEIRSSIMWNEGKGRIYFTGKKASTPRSGHAYAVGFNPTTGHFDTTDYWVTDIDYSTSTPTYYNGKIYVCIGGVYGGEPAVLRCLDESNGDILYNYSLGSDVSQSSPAVSVVNGHVYIYFTTNVNNGSAYCVEDTGPVTEFVQRWEWNPPAPDDNHILQGMAVSDGFVYFGTDEGYVYALKEGLQGELEIPIYNGKNLIAVPLIQDDTSLDAVFGDNPIINDRVHRYYNSLGLYKSSRYTGTSWWHPENVEPIEPEVGYVYERAGTDYTLTVQGTRCTGAISTPIYTGKNLVGYVNFTGTTLFTFNDPVTNDRAHRYYNSLGLYKSSRYTGTTWWHPENVEPIEVGVGYVYERVGADFDWTYDA